MKRSLREIAAESARKALGSTVSMYNRIFYERGYLAGHRAAKRAATRKPK